MSSMRPTNRTQARALQIGGTIVVAIIALFALNSLQSDGTGSANDLSTQSLLTLGGDNDADEPTSTPLPTSVPTTAPILAPTATPVPPTPTPPPTATAVPPTPEPTATAVPPTAVPTSPPAAVADSGSVTTEAAEPAPPEPTPIPPTPVPATPIPPTPAPTATPDPAALVVEVEPTPEPTATATPTPTPIPVADPATLENYVLGEINQIRANAGLGPLALDPAISLISRDWSQTMATGGFFEHRPGDQLNVMLPSGWRKWGENIASAPNIAFAQDSLEASPGHYANMVDPSFTHIGIGVFVTGRQVWVTQNFAQY